VAATNHQVLIHVLGREDAFDLSRNRTKQMWFMTTERPIWTSVHRASAYRLNIRTVRGISFTTNK